jgi:hypothetical protein
LVAPGAHTIIDQELRQRRKALGEFMHQAGVPKRLVLSPATPSISVA